MSSYSLQADMCPQLTKQRVLLAYNRGLYMIYGVHKESCITVWQSFMKSFFPFPKRLVRLKVKFSQVQCSWGLSEDHMEPSLPVLSPDRGWSLGFFVNRSARENVSHPALYRSLPDHWYWCSLQIGWDSGQSILWSKTTDLTGLLQGIHLYLLYLCQVAPIELC